MKIADTGVGVLVKPNLPSQDFRIKASRKAFEILSSGLYSDKIRAIVRELSTNAADAHIAAGKRDVPFEVHLPNRLEPYFSVTDYGTGLSDNDVLQVYTTYFESSKTNSNDFTGCLGLGSKSPFSYTDSFTVESRFNGMKRIYNAHLNEEGYPSCIRLSEAETDEPNGLTVSFPVASGDFHEFISKAEVVYKWFRVKPIVKGVQDFTLEETTYLRKTDRYAICETRRHESYAVMGNVAYPLHYYDFSENELSQNHRNLVEWGVDLYLNIGDADIAASREKLSYDKPTKKLLRERIVEAFNDFQTEVTKEIDTKPTIWQARRALNRIRRSFKGFDIAGTWQGNPLKDYADNVITVKDAQGNDASLNVATIEKMYQAYGRKGNNTLKKEKCGKLYADGTKIFLNDCHGAYSRVREYLDNLPNGTHVYLVTVREGHSAWLTDTGISEEMVRTSTLPKPERGTGAARDKTTKAKLYKFMPSGNASNNGLKAAAYWEPVEVDELEKGGVYVEILYFKYRMKEGEGTQEPTNLKYPLERLETLGKGVTVYGVRPNDVELLEDSGGDWITFDEYHKKAVEELHAEWEPKYLKMLELQNVGNDYSRFPAGFFKKTVFNHDSLFGNYVREFAEAKAICDDDAVNTYRRLRGILPDPENLNRLKDMWEAVEKKYPLLLACKDRVSTYKDEIAGYVRMIDNLPTE